MLRHMHLMCKRNCIERRHSITFYSVKAVLGIETSCDDTGAAVIDANSGRILGEAVHSQIKQHTLHGGIHIPVAKDLHSQNIEDIVSKAMTQSGLQFNDLYAVSASVKPGLIPCLEVGKGYGTRLALQFNKPFVPIHHMEAHATTVRMLEKVEFPYLCLLASGGHCILVLCNGVDDYKILGQSYDDAPGEVLDKAARFLCLRSVPELAAMGGGPAIEYLARQGNSQAFSLGSGTVALSHRHDCDFSFTGTKSAFKSLLKKLEAEHGIEDDDITLPSPVLQDLCASLQYTIFRHIVHRTIRALLFLDYSRVLPSSTLRTLVLSGGVGSNKVLSNWLQQVCEEHNWRLVVPPSKYCTDNGVMIAWNAVERIRHGGLGVLTRPQDIKAVETVHRCPLGEDISAQVSAMKIKVKSPRYPYRAS